MLDIQHLPSNWSDEKNSKDLLEVVLQQNEYASMLPIQHPEYIILGPIWPFANTLLKYNMWVHDADVVDTLFFGILAPSCYTIKNKKRGWESTKSVELEYRNEIKHLHSKYTDEGLV